MIKWYRFKNFYSFKDETVVDLTLKSNSSESSFDVDVNNSRVSKILAVLGSNGSGKSNLLKPLAFLSWFCEHSFKDLESKELLPFYPHFSTKEDCFEIEVCFTDLQLRHEDNAYEYKYHLKLTRSKVMLEELKLKTNRQFYSLFSRKYDEKESVYKVKVNSAFSKPQGFPKDELLRIPDNASAISYFNRKESAVAKVVLNNFSSIDNNLNAHGKYNLSYKDVMRATKIYAEDEELFNKAVKILKRMDFGLSDIKIKKEEVIDEKTGEAKSKYLPYGVHEHDGNVYEVPFYMESSGTQACYSFIQSLLYSLEYGGIAIIDELDSDLHPIMVVELLSMFENEDINKNNAQLIFSCHTPEVLKHLKKHHVYLVEKNESASECWRLDEMKGLRSQDNLYSKYITGALGGVPDICL
ncbi:TPA: AAA family ATPase [Serratia marcescens]|nr:AAA family ATPase [Serratia marcescens]HAT3784695.1 AAA family ATPase [Serratia marcescens]HAT3789687.1 AAA family ATPase [Serratia marcescens]